ncbi:contractile injection system protein, VgrG/Pvc8 family [Halomonas sp. GD1P12]|uniref:contractile injection system protein, VgrG/Pvc8 family n=1 Tax=Halomonas sp. GD1P12 TaxID=2982691 RepID=UPI0021E46D70|nr:contractile injection system protein, VgrG/Pvc8 family [Halomonas sp. GD1P12]UYF99346.1 contractile injection system protein, VgrG/Pvc8 family [Halomonas sp. GD1P12]
MSIQPDYRITLQGQVISPEFRARLASLTLHDRRGMQADQLDIVLTDDDGMLDIPPTGAELILAIGWKGQPLSERGTFIVDEVEHTGAPDTLNIRASSANLRAGLPGKRTQSWDSVTVRDIIETIAARHDLTPSVGATLAGVRVTHIDQTDESDLHFLTRLAERFDAVATVKTGHLIFVPAGQATTATGLTIPPITLRRQTGDQHRYLKAEREAYSGVTALWNNTAHATREAVTVGEPENAQQLRHTYVSETEALEAAQAEWQRLQRGTAYFSITQAAGEPELFPETPAWCNGWKRQIDETPWIIVEVIHRLTDTSYTTTLELETRPNN